MMRFTSILIILLSLSTLGHAQMKDSAFYARVDDRVEIMMDHFSKQVSNEVAWTDTIAYVQRLFANHIEIIRLKTSLERHRRPMYDYALSLRNKSLASILPIEILQAYWNSFQSETNGFTFCRICRIGYSKGIATCGNCGERF
jgi:hypothetical protein